ncbi:MAG: cadherin-like beta sandwich domain-containing protein [Treponema sp.]|nr:cadherin-like beta sandwich domain-containing protein [Treponema sp.]
MKLKKCKFILNLSLALAFFYMLFSCSDIDSYSGEKGGEESSGAYASIVIPYSESRAVFSGELNSATVTVSGFGMESVSVSADIASGKGSVSLGGIKPGKNRVVKVESNISGAVLYELVDEVKAGVNTIPAVTWESTVLGGIYYNLILANVDVSSINKGDFDSVISSDLHASLVDVAAIAADYKAGGVGGLKTASSYKLETGSVVAVVYGYEGKSVQIADPASQLLSAGSDSETLTFADVLPGIWNVYVDGGKVTSVKVFSGEVTNLTIGQPTDRIIVHWKDTKGKNIYAWSTDSSQTEYFGVWPGKTDAEADSYGYYSATINATSSCVIFNGNGKTCDLKISSAGEYWWLGSENGNDSDWTNVNPNENVLSSDASLASISVNGTELSGFASNTTAYTTTITSSTTSAIVTALANDSAASVSVSPNGSASITSGSSQLFTITVTAEDGKTTKTYTVTVKRAVENDTTLASVSVNGKAAVISGTSATYAASGADDFFTVSSISALAVDSNASVTYSATTGSVADGKSKTFTITVKNGTKTAVYTLTVTYTKKTTPEYYWTNKNGAVGNNKTITGISSWSEEDKIIQGVACDTPRCWLGGHEYPDPDLYAMFAAWDDTNLYLLIEIPNVDDADAVDNDKCYAGSQFLPMGIVLNTGKRTAGNGLLDTGNSVWQGSALYTWEEGIDTMLMFHPRVGIGEPSIFKTQSDGTFTYESSVTVAANKQYCIGFATAGVEREIFFNKCVSSNMWTAVTDEDGNWGSKSSTDMDSYSYVDYMGSEYGKKMSSYQVTIPLSALDIDKNYIENTGISVGCFSTYGASAMDCLPWDSCMIDNAAESYSSDPSSSKEKEDADNITVSLARIGK